LEALDGKEVARRLLRAFQRYEPLEDLEKTPESAKHLRVTYETGKLAETRCGVANRDCAQAGAVLEPRA